MAAYAAVVAEVEVDESVRLSRVWCAADAGLVINPDGAINQLEGGIIQAASWALEGRGAARHRRHQLARLGELPGPALQRGAGGRLSSWSTPLPTARRSASARRRGGPTVAAIGNAVAHALGARLRDLPMTRERVMAALLRA